MTNAIARTALALSVLTVGMVTVGMVGLTTGTVGCGGSVASSPGGDGGTSPDGATGDTSTSSDGGAGEGGTPSYCGGKAGYVCPSDMWCAYAPGTCHDPDAAGTCRKREALPCTPPDPGGGTDVCGCDGTTYASACEAASASQSVLHDGACEAPPPSGCGGSSGTPCPAGEYCDFGDGTCPAPGSSGKCVTTPSGCPDIYAPVCGCDGKTYPNGCDAHAHGVTIASTGECAPSGGKTCGGFAGATCAPSEYCDWGTIPSACGGDDGMGTCEPRPTSCPPIDGVYCGCDGKVYESPCAAALAGTGVRNDGPCP